MINFSTSKIFKFSSKFVRICQFGPARNQEISDCNLTTLESGIDVGQGINVGPGKLGKKNKRRALNTHVLCSE